MAFGARRRLRRLSGNGDTSTSTAPARPRSAAVFDGPDRAAARAYMKGIGFDDAALSRPTIGIANTWTEAMPCNFHLRGLAEHIKDGVRAAGGTPMEFNTIAISDGITMGTKGMKASLVSREVIADSIELTARGYQFDAMVALSACDKTIPGCVMALARLDIPSVMLYGGSIAPGRWHDRDVTILDVFEAIGAHAAGEMSEQELRDLEDVASPGAGACGGQFTANTMACAFEALGISPGGSSMVPAEDEDKATVAEKIGELVMQVLAEDLRPSRVITRESLENAIACICASGGSTNGVLHMLAVAREAGLELSIDDFERISRHDPAARRPEAGRPLRGHRPLPRRRRAADPQPARRGGHPSHRRDHGQRPDDRRGGRARQREPRPGGGAPALGPAQERGRARDPARQPGAGGLGGQARRDRAHRPDRSRAGLRVRGGVLSARSRTS